MVHYNLYFSKRLHHAQLGQAPSTDPCAGAHSECDKYAKRHEFNSRERQFARGYREDDAQQDRNDDSSSNPIWEFLKFYWLMEFIGLCLRGLVAILAALFASSN